ncbi:hypothetical protein MASR2M70_22340 [Bacillota bacterium]
MAMHFKRALIKMIPVIVLVCFIFQTMVPSSAEEPENTNPRYAMSYIYFGDSGAYTGCVDRTEGSLNELSPNYFDLKADGSLSLTQAVNKGFVDEMHSRGISVVPFLSNHWNRELGQTALANMEALTEQLAEAVGKYDLDGVNVDIENLTEKERDLHTEFIRLLKEKLPEDKIIAVSVAANPYGINKGWKGSYDYEALGKHSDYLMIMAYDEHYNGSAPGTIAGISMAEKSIQYALGKVPKEKIVLGLPFYGRIWRDGPGYPQGVGIGNTEVQALIEKYDGKVIFDTKTMTPSATITVEAKDERPIIGGTAIEPDTYIIWFENQQSLKEKLKLLEKYDIKGAGSWSLGQETEDTWGYYKLWSNGCYFEDAAKHWARDYILKAYKNKWVRGVSDTSFSPEKTLTRAEGAAMLVRMLGLTAKTDEVPAFIDITGHWARDEIITAWGFNIVNGMSGDSFEPEAPVTREQMAFMLNNILKMYSISGPGQIISFSDLGSGINSRSRDAIMQVGGMGILSGFGDGSFRPGEALTRGQMTSIMCKLDKALEQP